MRAACASSRISAEPACPLTTFFTGQPKFMSMIRAPRSALSFAASAMTRGSQPASCTAIGCSSAQLLAIVIDWRVSRIIASLAIISETTSPAPSRLTRRRNGRSLTPDIGARMTGSSRLTEPIEMLIDCAYYALCLSIRQILACFILRCNINANCKLRRDGKSRRPAALSSGHVLGLRARSRGRPGQPVWRPLPKQYLPLGGATILRHAVAALGEHTAHRKCAWSRSGPRTERCSTAAWPA